MSVDIELNSNISEKLIDKKEDIQIVKTKKRTTLVSEYLNNFFREYLKDNEYELNRWNDNISQNTFVKFINDNKIKMTNPNKIENEIKKKLEKKEKRIDKAKSIQQSKIEKQQSQKKSAYYFFKLEEQDIIKIENPEFNKKDIHKELQNRWKTIKSTNRGLLYKEIAITKEKEDMKKNEDEKVLSNNYIPKIQKSAGAPPQKLKKEYINKIEQKKGKFSNEKDKRIENFRTINIIDKNLEEMNNNTVDTSRFIDYRK